MKPWLLNLLACPIDKHHPLEAYFFSWENGKPRIYSIDQTERLKKQLYDGTISVSALKSIQDLTENRYSLELYSNVMKFIDSDMVDWELEVLHQYLNVLDVKIGLLWCPECGRWYPIGSSVETIPELLPDHFRDKERDALFLERWKDKLPGKVKERIENE